ncbi:uncharacterized protein [Venturia canescens]|uniref:uncharacterized protein n=1 Tax=Venturia canescens TaxID=32260 RepID=UPI001C9D6188|nr:uncharacterized protein LOC122418031 [Venturia canescens]
MTAPSTGNVDKHIDEAQTKTAAEHFKVLLENEDTIDPEHSDLTPEDLPSWYDAELFKEGQNYYRKNLLSMNLVGLIGVLAVLAIPSILKILVFTKKSSTPCTAFTRYLETILHINALYTGDISDGNSEWWKSLNTIRWKHSTDSRRSSKALIGGITHRDMALTQFGFLGYALLAADKLSLTNEPEGREGLNHFWRVVGHVLGISDRMNICRKNEKETTELCKLLVENVYANEMRKNNANFEHMSSVLVDGLWSVDQALDYQAIVYLWYELSGVTYPGTLSTYSWLNMQYRSWVLYFLGLPYIGHFVRNGFNYYLRLNQWIVKRCPIVAYLRFGISNARIKLYPKIPTQKRSD